MRILAWGGIILGFLFVITGFTLQKQVKGHFLEPMAKRHQSPSFYRRMQGQALYFLALFIWIPSLRVIRNMETSILQTAIIAAIGLLIFAFFQLIIHLSDRTDE